MNQFLQVEVNDMSMSKNDKANVLAKLDASLTLHDQREI